MPVLTHIDIERFIKYVQEQLENERVLYEIQIVNAVEKLTEETDLSDIREQIFIQQWILINIPQLQDNRPAVKQQHEAVMRDKFEYYNRNHNFEGLYTWVASVLRNIGFMDNEANSVLTAAQKIGKKICSRN